jgi:putative ABC transport system permease protein
MRSPYTMIKKPQQMDRLQSFKAELKRLNGVRNITTSSSIPGCENIWLRNDVRKLDSAPENKNDFSFFNIDEDFIPIYEPKILAGRNFTNDDYGQRSLIINEEAVKTLGFKSGSDAVNQLIKVGNDQYQVAGVIANYHQEYLKKAVQPALFFYGYVWPHDVGYYSVKVNSYGVNSTLARIKNVWKTMYPDEPFEFFFLDQTFQKQYESDQQFGMIFTLFSVLSLALTCFGIFGLTSYNVLKRTKEIGIRKVLGANNGNIFYVLNKEFIKLLSISFIIALPFCIYLSLLWLSNYSFRISLNVILFIAPLLIVASIVLLTMSYQSIKAANINPTQSLKYE